LGLTFAEYAQAGVWREYHTRGYGDAVGWNSPAVRALVAWVHLGVPEEKQAVIAAAKGEKA